MHTYTHTETHTQVVLSFQTKHFFRRTKNQASPPQQRVHCVTKKDTMFSVHVFRMSCLQCKTVVSEEQITQNWHCNYSITKKKEKRQKAIIATQPSLSLSLHSSPITSSNDSNMSRCTCGSSKNGRHMWEKSDAVTEIQGEGFRRHTVSTRSKYFPSLFTFNHD